MTKKTRYEIDLCKQMLERHLEQLDGTVTDVIIFYDKFDAKARPLEVTIKLILEPDLDV